MRNKDLQHQRGFTLLELLIVIAIIGLLASVVMVQFPEAQKRARLAEAQVFADTLRGSLQMEMAANWAFDETSGTVAKDSWFDEINGTLNGNPQWVEGIINNALEFDGNDYVSVPADSFNNNSGTIEMWIKPNFNGASSFPAHIIFFKSGNKSFQIWSSNGYLYWLEGWTYCNRARNWVAGDWYHIVVAWEYSLNQASQEGVELYVNGKACGWMQNNTPYSFTATAVIGDGFDGTIDDVHIYSKALPQSAIQQHYAQGLTTHQNLAKK